MNTEMRLTRNQLACLLEAHHNKYEKSKFVGTYDPDMGYLRSRNLVAPGPTGDTTPRTTELGDQHVEAALKAIEELK